MKKARSKIAGTSVLRIIRKNPSSLVGLTLVTFFVLMAIFGPVVYPFDNTYRPSLRYLPPSIQYLLGTDFAGRDVLGQIINGARDVLITAFLTGILTTMLAAITGISSGMVGGVLDSALMMFTDIFLIIPQMPLLLMIAASLPRALTSWEVALIISAIGWAGLARTIRSQVLSIRDRPFIEASKCLNLSRIHILFNDILPNLLPYIVTSLVLAITQAVYAQVSLFYLGILPFSSVNWGVMIRLALGENALINTKAWIYLFSPVVCIVLLQVGFILSLHAVEEILNPRLRSEE
jgi:peptide/nickel transport system permease protein